MASLLGASYESSDDETPSTVPKPAEATNATKIVAAPEVNTEVWSLEASFHFIYNITVSPWAGCANSSTGPSSHADDAS